MNDGLSYSPLGLRLTEGFESLQLEAYQDSRGVWTVGYGHTGPMVHRGVRITPADADHFLASDVRSAEIAVRSYVKVKLNQNKFDALVDFTFNEGAAHLEESTLLKRVNAGDDEAAAREFLRWVYAGGERLEGLERRRKAESQLYLTKEEAYA